MKLRLATLLHILIVNSIPLHNHRRPAAATEPQRAEIKKARFILDTLDLDLQRATIFSLEFFFALR
jgi:hypothetical protein